MTSYAKLMLVAMLVAFSPALVQAKDTAPTGAAQADALVSPSVEVEAAFGTWLSTLSSGTPEAMTALYADDAILLATLDNTPLKTQETRKAYFTKLMSNKGLKATVGEKHMQLFGDTAIVSGTWTFSFEQDGKTAEIPARYNFVFHKPAQGGTWKVVNMHSSKLPNAN